MRSLVLIVAVACHSGGDTQPPKSPAPQPGPSVVQELATPAKQSPVAASPGVAFPESQMVSHFSEGQAATALKRLRRQEFKQAASAAQAAIRNADAQQKRNLEILLAVIHREQGNWLLAGEGFSKVATQDLVLADYLNFQAARAFARAGDARAGMHAQLVAASSPWASDLDLLRAEVARSEGKHKVASKLYHAYLEGEDEGHERLRSEARYRLGASLRIVGQTSEGTAVWRALAIADPVSRWALRARAEQMGLEDKLSSTERMERGMGYFRAMRNIESEADFASAIKRGDLTLEQRCQALFHRAKSVYKERAYKRSAPLFVPAIKACQESGNQNYEVKSAYQAGLAYSRAREHLRSASFYAQVERYPEHSYADDARLRQAEEYDDLGQNEKVTQLLSSLPQDYPKGDMRGEAMWRLARRAYQRKNYPQAIEWLKEQIRVTPIESNWWAEGQAQYWLGRSQAHVGQASEAAQSYQACIRLYPLTYYSMQAFNRLREAWPEHYQEILAEVKASPSPWQMAMQARPVYGEAEFKTALRLARLGLAEAASRQLSHLAFSVPPGRVAQNDPERKDWLIATTRLLDLAGDYAHSHWIGRWHNVDYRRSWPNGDNALRWRLAYPLAYWELLQEFAAGYTYPAHLQMAIVREESAFDPSRESYANAVGLTQMIFPTAIDHSKESGIKVTRENLQHPVKNVTIGSHFLESLQRAFEGRVGLMVPGYNAGRARVRGWIRARHRYDLDEFIERIAGDQARRYTKRVLGSFFTYRYLSEGTVPVVRNQVPRRLGKLK